MELERIFQNLLTTKTGYVVLLMNVVLQQLSDWLNKRINFEKLCEDPNTLAIIYQYVEILLFSHIKSFSTEINISILTQADSAEPFFEKLGLYLQIF